jgi:UDP-glucuronate decarboxylase
MRILVTGGAGFIGSHLCEKLLIDHHDVICLDNFFTGTRENIIHLMDNHRFELVRHDIIQSILLEVDQIYHFACPASPVHYQFNPVKTIKTNVMGTINMLGLAKRVKARIMLASTSEIYGDPQVHPQPENYWGHVNCVGIRSCYDEGKRVAETLMMDYHRQNNVDIKIVRIFNTYGPRMAMNDGRVISNFIVQALKDEPLTLYGEGNQSRSFQYVDDLVEGTTRMMALENETGPMNIGNPEEYSIKQLADIILQMTGSRSKIVHNPLPSDDPTQRQPDITIAQKKLGWQPTVALEEGLRKTITYFENILRKTPV